MWHIEWIPCTRVPVPQLPTARFCTLESSGIITSGYGGWVGILSVNRFPKHRDIFSQIKHNSWAILIGNKLYTQQTSLKVFSRTFFVVQWLRNCLPLQGMWVWSLVQEDSTWCRATKPVPHNYWACAPQLLKPGRSRALACNKRSHCNGTPAHCNKSSPHSLQLEKACTAAKTQHRRKISK